jgi:hypothetical protein
MDFEWKIRMLEKQLAHYHEMQELMPSRLDTHDNRLEAIIDTLARAGKIQEQTNQTVKTLAADLKMLSETVGVLAQKVSGLIDALRASSDGKP